MADTQDNKPTDDLSALAWVQAELRRSLEGANKALRRYLRDSESAGQSDVDAVDAAALRSARIQLHQGAGALELVGLRAGARLLRAAEAAVQRMVTRQALASEASVHTIERASFALLDYVGRLLAGKRLSAISLFPQYAAVQALAGADRVHPADLWESDFAWQELPADPAQAARAADDAARGTMEAIVLRLMRRPDALAWRRLSDLCTELAAGSHGRAAALWGLAAGFAEAESLGVLPRTDVHTKRMAARLLAQLRLSSQRQDEPSERLAQDLLFYCAHARADGVSAPRLAAVRRAWRLESEAPLDYEHERLGRFDPTWITQARKRVAGARDAWSEVAGGETQRLAALSEPFALLGDSLERLFPGGPRLSRALQATATQVQGAGGNPPAALAMEVATSILYVDATLEDGDLDQPELAERVQRLAERIEDVQGGSEPQPLEGWMEELYRRVSDRQTMGSVVHELRASLSEVEKQIDQYFRDPSQRALLIPVPGQLQAMRGVLSVLGLDQASAAVLHMRDEVDALAQTEVDPELAIKAGTFDHLADNLGALSFLIDMLSVQPALAKSLFRFDAEQGSLAAVMGQSERTTAFAGLDEAPVAEQARALADSVSNAPGADHGPALELLSQRALAADLPGVAGAVSSARMALARSSDDESRQAVGAELAQAVDSLLAAPPPAEPAPTPAPLPPSTVNLEDDAEMRDIFLEEAREVIATGGQALRALADEPEDLNELTTVRRAFHTLKGSSRMVGLRDYGEAAWSCEQLYNARLAGVPRMDEALDAFTQEALSYLAAWTEAIASGEPTAYRSGPVVAAADALRLQGLRQPIVTDAAAHAAASATAPVPSLATLLSASESESALVSAAEVSPAIESTLPLVDHVVQAPAVVELPVLDDPALPELDLASALTERVPDLPLASDLDLSVPLPQAQAPVPEFELDLGEVTQVELRGLEPAAAAELTLPETPERHELPEEPQVAEVVELDFGDFDRAREATALEAPGPFEATQPLEGLPLHEVPGTSPAVDDAEGASAAASELASLAAAQAATEDAPEAALDAAAERAAAPVAEPGGVFERDLKSDVAQAVEVDEQVKVIGELRIPIPLFNIYLNEADELSRRLCTELAEWGVEHERRGVGASAVTLAHSLAGSSATVGYTELSSLARALEHALLRACDHNSGTATEAALYSEAADEVRRLLHQFAAGFLRPMAPGLLERLAAAERESALRSTDFTPRTSLLDDGDLPAASVDEDESHALLSAVAPEPPRTRELVPPELALSDSGEVQAQEAALGEPPAPHGVASDESAVPDSPEPRPDARDVPQTYATPEAHAQAQTPETPETPETHHAQETPLPFPALASVFAPLAALPQLQPQPQPQPHVPPSRDASSADALDDAFDDEDMDVEDSIDHELFPIFEEEAEELLPQLQTRLRGWLAQPGDSDMPAACMRTLHTFKGGARLAGAMRLGELAHRLETAIEHLSATPHATPDQIEPLLVRADDMAAAFDALRRPAAAPQAPAAAPTAAAQALVATAAEPLPLPLAIAEQQLGLPASEQPPEIEVPHTAGAASEAAAAAEPAPLADIDWSRFDDRVATAAASQETRAGSSGHAVRVRAALLDRLVNQAGEVSITRARIDADMRQLQGAVNDLTDNLDRLRHQLRDIELQAESQITSRIEAAKAASQAFDPLEMDRFTRFQELTRMMAESVNDVATVQRSVQRTLQSTEDQLAAQARLTRELQDDLLRTRMVEFESLADRLYRVVRQAAKDCGKQVRLDIVGGSIEVDRGVLERMAGPFEHLLRNSVVHGIEDAAARQAAGKAAVGEIRVSITQEGNEIGVECRDDGAGLDLQRIRARALERGLLQPDEATDDAALANMIFRPGFSTAATVTELAGRGVGLDVVRAEVNAMGGRIETATTAGQGTGFKLVLPLTTAVTQVVLLRCDALQVAVPSTLIEVVRRVPSAEIEHAYASGGLAFADELLPFFRLSGLLQGSARAAAPGRTQTVVVVRSAAQRVALHVDEVLGNQEVVVKHIGPQLARLPGLVGVTLLPSGAAAMIYNPVALAALFGEDVRQRAATVSTAAALAQEAAAREAQVEQAPLVLVVDDSLTVRRVTQRLLVREGYRVALAKDGLEAIERLAQERPAIMLTDIEMPRMDGFDLVRNLRADTALAGLPVIMITSRIAQKHRDYAAELGVDHYLGKPYAEEELLRLVAQHVGAPLAALS